MNIPVEILKEALSKLPEPNQYPDNALKIPYILYDEKVVGIYQEVRPEYLTFWKSTDGKRWELVI